MLTRLTSKVEVHTKHLQTPRGTLSQRILLGCLGGRAVQALRSLESWIGLASSLSSVLYSGRLQGCLSGQNKATALMQSTFRDAQLWAHNYDHMNCRLNKREGAAPVFCLLFTHSMPRPGNNATELLRNCKFFHTPPRASWP